MTLAVHVPYQPGMVLGRTFDLKCMSPGVDIFINDAVKDVQTTRRHHNTMKYAVIKSSQDVNKILGISGDISLKAKVGLIDVKGMGSYFSEDIRSENTVKILARAHVETGTDTMTELTPRRNWKKPIIGTHFIRSMTYGGALTVSIEIGGTDTKQKQDAKAQLEAQLNFITGSVRANTGTETLGGEKKNQTQIRIEYFSTTPTGVMPRDVDGMLKALDSFKEEVMKVNEGKGVPFSCELLPLCILDPSIPIGKQRINETQLQQLEDCYDDVRSALTKLDTFTRREEVELTEEEDGKVREVTDRMEKVMELFNKVISSLDVSSEEEQLKLAQEEYKKSKKTGGFYKEVSKLTKALTPIKDSTESEAIHDLDVIPLGVPLDIILLGKYARGKTSTGNTIFGREEFPYTAATKSTKPECLKIRRKVGERCFTVVDIQRTKQDHIFSQFARMLLQNPDGFHAFLIVMSEGESMTDEDVQRVHELKNAYEEILFKYSVIIFTGGDTFCTRMEQEGKDITFDRYIKAQEGPMKTLIQDCGGRYLLINNMETGASARMEQAGKLIRIVSKLAEDNHYARYTNRFFKIAAVVDIDRYLFRGGLESIFRGVLLNETERKARFLEDLLRQEKNPQELKTFVAFLFPEFKDTAACVVS